VRARDLGDDRILTDAMELVMAFLRAPRDLQLVEQLEQELSSRPHTGLRTYPLAARLLWVARMRLGRGDRQGAEKAWQELLDITQQRRDARLEVWALAAPIWIAVLDGRLEEAVDLVEAQRRLAQETGILGVQFGVGFPLTKVPNARVHHMLGRDVGRQGASAAPACQHSQHGHAVSR
jgi:hypothetical protein